MAAALLRFWLLLVTCCGVVATARAQYEFNSWRFGAHAGLDFPGTPTASPPSPAASNSAFYSLEASASVADSTGRLLCYTNAEQVWDRRNQLMPNGTLRGGCNSAAQGALLLPRPGNRQQYYLLTLDCFEHRMIGGLRYSVVDMTLNNGFGDVVMPNSLQVGVPRTTEALTAVRHADGINYWVVIHLWQSNVFLSYPVLATGLGTPVQSSVGSIHGMLNSPNLTEGYGSLRASPNGQWLAATNPDRNLAEILAFDNRTGQVSNARQVPLALPVGVSPYGLEFAAGNGLLYLTTGFSTAAAIPGAFEGLFQVDLRQPGLPVTQLATGGFGALLRGPDNRVYVTDNFAGLPTSSLGVISQPDVAGAACGYQPASVGLGTGRRATGLPNFPNRGRQRLRAQRTGGACLGELASFTATAANLDPPVGIDSVALSWDFGDPASGQANSATGAAAQHRYGRPGPYLVTLTAATANARLQTQVSFYVSELPSLRISPRDTLVCEEAGMQLQASRQPYGTTYRWQDGSTAPALRANRSGVYWLEVRNPAGCTARDTVLVTARPCPVNIPTIITPNGDAFNQAFVLKGLNAPDWNVRVYNRWGREVYSQERYDNGWAAEGQPAGVYYYLLRNAQTGQQLKGWVEVVR